VTNPTISIVTPSYNQAEFIERNLRSVMGQDYGAIEHVVIDGGSTDGTVEILRRYESEYNLRWVSEDDQGQTHAINKGIEMATGDVIGWQNSDDFYLPGAFERVAEALRESPDVDVIYGDVVVVNENGIEVNRKYKTPPSAFINRYYSIYACNQAAFFRAEVFNEVGLLDEDLEYTMDAEIFHRLLDADCNLRHFPEFFGAFRIQTGAKTHGRDIWELRAELEDRYPDRWYDRMVPQPVLTAAAVGLKAAYLLRDRRWDAFRNNLPVIA